MRTVLTGLLVLAAVGVSFFYLVSGTWRFYLGWNSRTEQGGDQQQLYVEGIGEPGTLLAGWRSEPKFSDVPFPRWFWTLGESAPITAGGAPLSETTAPRSYTFGVARQSFAIPERHFRARFLYVRFWLLELVLCGLLAALWAPSVLMRSRTAPAAPPPTAG